MIHNDTILLFLLLAIWNVSAAENLHTVCARGPLSAVLSALDQIESEHLVTALSERNEYKHTPLMSTIVSTSRSNLQRATESVKIVRLLIEKGSNVNAVDKYGFTPLSHAAYFGALSELQEIAEEMFEILLAANANPLIIDKFGLTAEQTMQGMCPKCSAVLRKYGFPEPEEPQINPNWKEDTEKDEL